MAKFLLMKIRILALLLLGTALGNVSYAQHFISDLNALDSTLQPIVVKNAGVPGAVGLDSPAQTTWFEVRPATAELTAASLSHFEKGNLNGFLTLYNFEDEHHGIRSSSGDRHGDASGATQGGHSGLDFHGSAIPEPASYATFLGLAALVLTVWRRRASLR